MADGEYMRFAHGRCSLPVSAAKPQQSGSSKPKCTQCGAARSRTKPHEVSVLCRDCYRKSVGYVPPVVRRCLWCLATYVPKDAKVRLGKSGGWFCSRECSFADRSLHGMPDGSFTRNAWREYGRQFDPKQADPKQAITSNCIECGNIVGAHAQRCDECNRRRNSKRTAIRQRSERSVIRTCPSCMLTWSALGKAGVRKHCHTAECQDAFKLHQREVRRAARLRAGGSNHQSRARRYGGAREAFNPLDVLARDRWRCQLCGIKTPQDKRGSMDDNAPELDHIIPLSKGGPHTRANTQCLCRKCNSVKGDAARGQLGLSL